MVNSINTIREAFDQWKGALVDQAKQTTQAARHRAHARVTSMEDLIAETPADDIEGVGIKLALYIYMSGVDPETADSQVRLRYGGSYRSYFTVCPGIPTPRIVARPTTTIIGSKQLPARRDGTRAHGRGPSREASEEAALRNWNAKFRDLDTREPE